MMRSHTFVCAAALALSALLPACSAPNDTGNAGSVTAREQRSADALKARYKDVVTGTDVQGNTLAVFVDVNNMYSMDEQAEIDMKADALAQWKRIWSASHRGKHATLRLSMRDYYGKEVYAASTRV